MADEAKIAPEVEAKDTTVVAEVKETKPEDKLISEVVKAEVAPEVEKAKTVPEAVFLEEKRERKELAKELKEVKKLLEEGASKREVSADIKDLAEEFGLTEQAISKLIDKVGEKTKVEYEKEIAAKLEPLQAKERAERVEKTFNEHFDKLMEAMPEYKGIANKEVIKALSLNKDNANKTFAKILEDSYGHLVVGKKTLETTSARGGDSDSPIDFKRASKDSAYLSEILSNPETKKKYNDDLLTRLRL